MMTVKPRLLITGINGLIGRIVAAPLANAYDVYGLDIEGPFSERVSQVDVGNYTELADVLGKICPVAFIVHLAGQANTHATWEDVLRANIIGTRNVYEVARVFGVQRVVFASSNHVTGAYEGFEPGLHQQELAGRITVHDPIQPDSDYGVSKAFGEAVASYYRARWGIESVCLRIGSVRPNDDPRGDPRFMKTWLSHRDLRQLIEKSLSAKVAFGVYYGVSDNRGAFWDIANARSELGYQPEDDAGRLAGG